MNMAHRNVFHQLENKMFNYLNNHFVLVISLHRCRDFSENVVFHTNSNM